MATDKKQEQEMTVEERLKAVYDLQTLLSQIDKIKTIRGELPLEVKDLEDEIEGLKTRIVKFKDGIEELRKSVAGKKNEILDAKAAINKYAEQQDNVRNNKEFDFLAKEINFKNLEIELCESESANIQSNQTVCKQISLRLKSNSKTEITSSTRKRTNLTTSFLKPNKMRRNCANRLKNLKTKLSHACSRRSNASAQTFVTVWESLL